MKNILLAIILSTAATAISQGAVCPKGAKPSERIYVCDVSKFTVQEQLFFTSIQGITAQNKPRIYLIRESDTDNFWLNYLLEKKYIKETVNADPWKLHEMFRSEISGAVVFDPKLSAYVNAATMISGIEKLAICTPEIAERTGLPIKIDLRDKWKTNSEVYTWAIDNLYPKLNKSIICSLYPYAAGGWLRDYLIQHKIFTFWISKPGDKDIVGQTPDEEEVMGNILKKWRSNIPVIGFWYAGADELGINEYNGLTLAGKSGKFSVVHDWATNTSIHSGIRVSPDVFKQKHAPKLTLDRSKIYVMMIQFESGDAPFYWQRLQYKDWLQDVHGKFPMGWCLGPLTLDLLPAVLQWHYENASPNDYFFCSMSGVGYTMTHAFGDGMPNKEQVWKRFLSMTNTYMKRLDLDMVSLHTDAWHAEPQYEDSIVFKRYTDNISGLKAILSDFGRLEKLDLERAAHIANGVPVFHTLSRWDTRWDTAEKIDDVEYLVEQMQSFTPKSRPAFMSIMALSWTCRPDIIKKAMDRMGSDYVFVTPEQMVDLYKQSRASSE